jgi:hypothetical protein
MVKLFELKANNEWSDCSFKELLMLLFQLNACKNDCILYHGPEYEDLDKCPICGLDRFNRRKDGGDDENCNRNRRKVRPKKVFWYFSIIPRLKRWLANKKESELLRWHKEKHKQDARMIRHPTDAT